MTEKINVKVNVITVYDRNKTIPLRLKWKGRIYKITQVGYQHSQKLGNVLHHIFSVTDGNLAFRLNFDTEVLSWTLEEVSDGLAN